MTKTNKAHKKEIGFNLLIDIYEVKKDKFHLKELLSLLKKILNLTKTSPVGNPIIKKITSAKYPWDGYSIIQILKESHIAIHTWQEYNYLAFDIFSCKNFDVKKLLDFLKKEFEGSKIKCKIYRRGIKIKVQSSKKEDKKY